MDILLPVIILGIMGIIFALVLYFASEAFYVPVDPKVEEVNNALPGVNCGACGYPGCAGLAEAIANGVAPVDSCPVGGEDTAEDIASIMGQDATGMIKNVAVVRCQGDNARAKDKYQYLGTGDCRAMALQTGGNKLCPSGCLGGGTCKDVCEFGAVEIVNGLAIIDKDKCVACEKCVSACPKEIIEMVPYDRESIVLCSSKDKGKDVRKYCEVGCIGCNICAKQYPEGFEVENFLAHSVYDVENVNEEALENAVNKCPNDCISPNDHRKETLASANKESVKI